MLGFAWGDAAAWAAAGATLVLCGVTWWYVRLTSSLSEKAERSADAAARSASVAQQSLILSALPLVCVVYRGNAAALAPEEPVELRPGQPLTIEVRNCGGSIAFGVTVGIADLLLMSHVTLGTATRDLEAVWNISVLEPGNGQRFVLIPQQHWANVAWYEAKCWYKDAAGNRYRTSQLLVVPPYLVNDPRKFMTLAALAGAAEAEPDWPGTPMKGLGLGAPTIERKERSSDKWRPIGDLGRTTGTASTGH